MGANIMKELLGKVFLELDDLVETENRDREDMGGALIPRAQIKILGQTSLPVPSLFGFKKYRGFGD